MATEYICWAMTSVLGAQENRADAIQQEWKLNTEAKVRQTGTAVYQLLTDPQYVFPTVLPDGTYREVGDEGNAAQQQTGEHQQCISVQFRMVKRSRPLRQTQ